MSSDSNQNHSRRASYVVRETPVPLPSYAGTHQGQTSSSPASASENSNSMSSSGRQLRSRRAAPAGPPPAPEPPSKKRKAASGTRAAPVESPQEQPVQPVPPPHPHHDGESQGQPEQPQPSKEMPIIGPPLQPGADASAPNHNSNNNNADDETYRMPPLPPYLHEPPRICEPAANYRGWSTPLEFSYKMPVHPLTFYGSFDIWFEQVQKIAEACHCAAELNTRIGTFPNPGTVEAFICQTRFLSCWRILHGTISGSYWAYMRVLGYSRIPVFMGAPDGDLEVEERGGAGSGGSLQCQWQPQPSDCVYFALEVKKRVMVPSSDNQPRYQTMRMVEEVRSAKPSDYPSLQQYREGMGWLKEVLNGFILKGDRQVCESLYDRKPDWAPEWTDVPQQDGEIEPPWALKGHPIRVEEAFATPVTAGTGGPNGKAEHHHQPQPQPQYHIDPQLQGSSNHHGNNNHAIARLAPMSVSGASSSDGGSGDYNNNYVPDSLPAVGHHYPNNNGHSHNLIFQDGTTSNAAAVAAAEAHGLGSAGSGGGPTTRDHGHQQQHNLFDQQQQQHSPPNDRIGSWN
ncbi:hypothetical protein B0T20DRAFT_342969 [Sordaria brevicollis]|uniref:Uncharacterized protein n=1 Tax=Sordaria brevicollis TaxID=83679 RepID=A0AAE0PP40_SORBR|nr:hypothetical protein B0T20DRAFT_342969 [Sordaria brevicollis]